MEALESIDEAKPIEKPKSVGEYVPIAKPKPIGKPRPIAKPRSIAKPKPIEKPRPIVENKPTQPLEDIKPIGDNLTENIPEEEIKGDDFSKEELDEIIQDQTEKTIQIDPNNPESLPIPKLLNSYVICEKGILTSQEAFEEVASHSSEEVLLEAPTIKDMGERFLSSIAEIKTRIIIQEFDLEDISYVLLLSSLIKKGVEIKTLPLVNSFNLIGDDSHALLISNSIDEDDFEYGAVYTDKPSIDNIKELFESSWSIANDLDIGNLNESE